MEAEKRLKEAEKSLNELGHAVEHETPNVHQDVKYEMVVNVNKLKSKNCIALALCLLGNFWGLGIYIVSFSICLTSMLSFSDTNLTPFEP